VGFKYLVHKIERVIQDIIRAIHSDVKLHHGLVQASLLVQHLKLAMMLIENGVLGVQHQAIGGSHVMLLAALSAHSSKTGCGEQSYVWVGTQV
jgi:hypothetical protein